MTHDDDEARPGRVGAPWRIRPAVRSDVSTIVDLIRQLAEFERLRHEAVVTEADLAATLFDRTCAHVLLVEQAGQSIGFALYFFTYSTFLGKPGLYLEDLFVVPSARSRGIGSALMHRLAQIAVAERCGRFEWSVLDWNTDARRFYERLGARCMEAWRTYRLTGEALDRLASTGQSAV